MTPQELKNSILQLAIQGKLVEQRLEEGTAEELYQQIQQEKQRLIKEGKTKKEKPLPDITEEEKPFDIPDSWKWFHLIDFCNEIFSGKSPVYSKSETPYRIIGQAANQNKGIDYSQIKYTNEEFWSSMEDRYFLRENDVLLNTLGNGTLGRSGIVTCLAYPLLTDGHLFVFRCINGVASKYLYYFLQLKRSEIEKRAFGSTNQTFLNLRNTINWIIPVPPFTEQKRIVAKIEGLLPLIDRYEKAWSQLEEFNKRFPDDMQKSILQMAIQGKLVEQRPEEGTGEELYQQILKEKNNRITKGELKKTKSLPSITDEMFPYDIPDTWKVCYIDDLAFVTKLAGFEYTEYVAPNLVSSGIPLFKGKNVQNGSVVLNFESYISEETSDKLSRSQIRKKCLLTPYVGTIGNIAIFDGSFRAHLGSNVAKIELFNGDEQYVLEEYVLFYLRSSVGYSELTKHKKATAQESISIDAIRNVIIPLPPLPEQKRIVNKLEELLPLCERINI